MRRGSIALAMGWRAQGKKLRAAPLQLGGKRRSRPLPTKAIHEVGNERGSYPLRPRRFGEGRIFRSIDRRTVARVQSPLCLPMSGASWSPSGANGNVTLKPVGGIRSHGNRYALPNQHDDRDAFGQSVLAARADRTASSSKTMARCICLVPYVLSNLRSTSQTPPRSTLPDGALCWRCRFRSRRLRHHDERRRLKRRRFEISTDCAHRPQLVDGLLVQHDIIVIIDRII